MRGTEAKTRTNTPPATFIATPVFDGAHWDEAEDAGAHPTIQQIFENLEPEAIDSRYGNNGRMIQNDGKDRPSSANSLPALSQKRPTRTAARMPLGMPISSENAIATAARSSELGSRAR